MKEEKFNKKYGISPRIITPVYYALDNNGHVIIDEKVTREFFENRLKEFLKLNLNK